MDVKHVTFLGLPLLFMNIFRKRIHFIQLNVMLFSVFVSLAGHIGPADLGLVAVGKGEGGTDILPKIRLSFPFPPFSLSLPFFPCVFCT